MCQIVSEVPVPTDAIDRELSGIAQRRFTGRVKLSLRVRPEAALAVEILAPETTEMQRLGERPLRSPARTCSAWDPIEWRWLAWLGHYMIENWATGVNE